MFCKGFSSNSLSCLWWFLKFLGGNFFRNTLGWLLLKPTETKYDQDSTYLSEVLLWKVIFCNLMLGEKEWKYVAQQISLAHRTINFSQVLKRNLLPETYCFSGSTNIYLIRFNNNNVQNMFKVNNRSTRRSSVPFVVNFHG